MPADEVAAAVGCVVAVEGSAVVAVVVADSVAPVVG